MNQTEEYDLRIISGAAELFRQFGIRAVTMDMIANHLGVSKRTIYERFIDKDTLLYAVLDSMIMKQRERIEGILESTPDVVSAVFTIIRMGRDHAATMNPLINSDLKKYHSQVLRRLKEKCGHPDHEAGVRILETGIRQGIFRETVNTEILSRAFRGVAAMAGDEELFPSEMFERNDIMKNVMVSFMRGISTRKGVALIDSMEKKML